MSNVQVQQMDDVPALYRCEYSGRVMVEPIVVVQTGKTYDISSIKYLDQDQIQYMDFVLLPDLKSVIQKFLQCNVHDNQPEEIAQNLDQDQMVQGAQGDLTVMANQYKQKMEDLHAFNDQVSEAFESLKETKQSVQTAIKNYQSQNKEISQVGDRLQELDLDSDFDSKITWEIRNKWVAASKLFFSVMDECSLVLLQLFQRQKRFEQFFKVLQSKEQILLSLRDNLQNVLDDFNITEKFDALSKQYTKPKVISESQLNDLFTNTPDISNISVHLESGESEKVIEVNGSFRIKGLQVTSANQRIQFLRFVMKSSACNIEFFDCKFIGVGLRVTGYQNTNRVRMESMEVLDVPVHSIWIENCNNFYFKDGFLKNSQYGLVLHNSGSSIVEDVISSDMSLDGFHSNNSITHYKNCVATNAKRAGVYIINCTVTAQSMRYEGNTHNTYGEKGSKYVDI